MRQIRFGITGAGHMGRTHAEAIRRLDKAAVLVAVWGGSRAPDLAARYGCACEDTVEALAGRPDIDAIAICTPHHLHFREAMLAIEAGKHVFIEKPMATTLADCDRLIESAALRHLVIGVGYNARFMKTPQRARELITANAIGNIRLIHFSMFYDGAEFNIRHSDGRKYAWYGLPESVGFLLDGLPHGIDMIRWLTGAEAKSVSGFCRTFSPERPLVEDTSVGIIEFSNGAICSVSTSVAAPGPYPGEYFRLSIIGSEGILDLDVANELHISDREKGWRLVAAETKEAITFGNVDAEEVFGGLRMVSYCDQMQSFIDGINGLPMRAGNGTDGRAGLAPGLAMLQSSRERRLIELR